MVDQTFKDAIDETRKSISRFQKIEGKEWGVEGAVIELAKQVGELSALIMNQEGYYFSGRDKLSDKYASSQDSIADELASEDCKTFVKRLYNVFFIIGRDEYSNILHSQHYISYNVVNEEEGYSLRPSDCCAIYFASLIFCCNVFFADSQQ